MLCSRKISFRHICSRKRWLQKLIFHHALNHKNFKNIHFLRYIPSTVILCYNTLHIAKEWVSNYFSKFCPTMLESGTRSWGTTNVMLKVALSAGSSQQGKQRRASVASNWVTAEYRSSPDTLCGYEWNWVILGVLTLYIDSIITNHSTGIPHYAIHCYAAFHFYNFYFLLLSVCYTISYVSFLRYFECALIHSTHKCIVNTVFHSSIITCSLSHGFH